MALTVALVAPATAAATDAPGPPAPNPDQRRYEQVSTPDRSGGDVLWWQLSVSPDGEKADYSSETVIGEPLGAPQYVDQLATRTPQGWRSEPIAPPYTSLGFGGANVTNYTPDYSKYIWTGIMQLQGEEPDSGNTYIRTQSTGQLNRIGGGTLLAGDGPSVEATNRDLTSVLIKQNSVRTPDAPAGAAVLYLWHDDGRIELVGKYPDGEPIVNESVGTPLLDSPDNPQLVDPTGSRVLFSANEGSWNNSNLYLWENGHTVEATAPTASTPDPNGRLDAQLGWTSEDLTKIFFTSCEALTNGSTADLNGAPNCNPVSSGGPGGSKSDLYLYDSETEELSDLTTQDPSGAKLLTVLGGARDGSSVYFAALGDLAPGGQGELPNIYLWQRGRGLRYVATLHECDAADVGAKRCSDLSFGGSQEDRVTPNGRYLLFSSVESLGGADAQGFRSAYLYDAQDESITCVSCNPQTGVAEGAISLSGKLTKASHGPRSLSADGQMAFFDSDAALRPNDTNGQSDVYEWHDGKLALVSSGTGSQGAYFVDASADGSSVFFRTRQRLVGWDRDNQIDLYVAREGGGFPEPVEPPAPCADESCKPAPPPVPAADEPGSTGGLPGNARERRLCTASRHRAVRRPHGKRRSSHRASAAARAKAHCKRGRR